MEETNETNGKYKISFGQNSKQEWSIKEARVYSDDLKVLETDLNEVINIANKKLKEIGG